MISPPLQIVHLVPVAVVVRLAVGLVLAVLSHPPILAHALAALRKSMISTHLSVHICFHFFGVGTSASASFSSSTTLRSAHDLTFYLNKKKTANPAASTT